MARVVVLAATSLLAASFTRVPLAAGAQREMSRAERAASNAQREFESYRRFRLPRVAAREGRCDLTIGRFCYWDENDDDPLPAEQTSIGRARARLRSTLDSLAAEDSTSDFIAGQRVRYAIEAGDPLAATTALESCAATPWWCLSLRGLAWHQAGVESRSAATYDSALAAMPDTLRCAWLDISAWLPPDTHLSDGKPPDCGERVRLSARVLWLAAPLLSWRPRATRNELLARRTLLALISGTATPHSIAWGSDIVEVALRFDWPDGWARENASTSIIATPEIHVVGHEPTPSFNFVPNRRALQSPLQASPADWQLTGDARPPMRYAPGWLTVIDTLPVQIARFVRAGGDSMVIVAAFDARAVFGEYRTANSTSSADVSASRDSTLRAAALLAVAPESTLATGRSLGSSGGAITLVASSRPTLAAVEVVDSAHGRAARWRGGVTPLDRSTLISDLLVGIASSAAPPILLDSAAPHAIAPLSVLAGDTIALYWELYVRASPGDPARVALRLVPLSASFLSRIGRALGLAHAKPPVSLAWDDSGRPAAEVGRSLRVAIPTCRGADIVSSSWSRPTASAEVRRARSRSGRFTIRRTSPTRTTHV